MIIESQGSYPFWKGPNFNYPFFCLSIVKRYFYRVDLDPGFRVLDSNEAELLRYEAVDEVFEDRYRAGPDKYEFFPVL